MSGNTYPHCGKHPIFVGASGRRLRRLRVAGVMVVVPAVGFIGVLLIALLSGFLIRSPVLPFAASPKTVTASLRPQSQLVISTTRDPARLSVVDAVTTSRVSDLAPPAAGLSSMANPSLTSKAMSRPVLAAAKAMVMGGSAAKRRLVAVAAKVTAKVTAKGNPSARGRLVAVAAKVTAKVTAKGKPSAKGKPTTLLTSTRRPMKAVR